MSKKYVSVIIFVVVAVIIVIAITALMPSAIQNPATSGTSANVETINSNTGTTGAKTYSLADVMRHNVKTDCWTTINGAVYDVTSWISEHPGGTQAVVGLCGIDGSDAFNGQHGGERRPASELASFRIGDLAK